MKNLRKQFNYSIWIFLLACSKICLSQYLINSNIRKLQISTLDSLAYSSYTSVQIFRMLNWRINNEVIQEINNHKTNTFIAGHNQFSYLSTNQIYDQYLNINPINISKIVFIPPKILPNNKQPSKLSTNNVQITQGASSSSNVKIDWRGGLSTPVKNQGKCGACWAFAAVASLQSLYLSKYTTQRQIDFSQQQLIDCSTSFGNEGCSGGMMQNAYQYVLKKGITLQKYYAYSQTKNTCLYNSETMPHFSISGSKIIQGDCKALRNILQLRPVSVLVSANLSFIFFYQGILNDCGNQINHAIELVGLIQNNIENYYIGKNSWGINWGMKGYIYINSISSNGNLCRVCDYVQYPQ